MSILSPGPQTPTAQARNPITLRLRKILGTNFNDEATRQAVRTLSDIYGSPSPSGGFESKQQLNNADADADISDDDEDHKTDENRSLRSPLVEHVPGEIATRTRKNLRRDLENKLAAGSIQFLNAFGEVNQKLDELQRHVAAMRARCDEAESQLRSTHEASSSLLDRASSLRQERQDVEIRKSIILLFIQRFTLSEDEIEAMVSRDVPVGSRFFEAMSKTQRIRNDCRLLMAGEDGPTKIGLDVMSSTSSYLEQGYEKIFRWCSFQFRQMGRDVQPDVGGPTMHDAIRRLREHPELFAQALAFLSQTRQTALLGAFLDALTRGGPSGLPRPIELHAHDPIRYVGDMLAWVHQAIAAEHEFLESLFDVSGERRMVGSVRTSKETQEFQWTQDLMDSAVSRLCVPLKTRVQQTVRSQESSITLYKIANLLKYYRLTMCRTIGKDALLSKTLDEMMEMSFNVFFESIETQARALSRFSLDLEDPEVAPPLNLLEHAQLLREIMQVYDSSLLGEDESTPVPSDDAGFKRVLDVMVDPAIEALSAAAIQKQLSRPRWDQAIFQLNCLTYLQSVLESFPFAAKKQEEIQLLVDKKVKSLTDEHYQNILRDAGLYDAITTCESRNPSEALARIPATQPAQLQNTLSKFSLWLSGLEVVQSPRLARLSAQRLHMAIHQAALARLTKAYERLCEEVRRPENRYEAASTLLGSERPFGQVGLLWQIFGLEGEETGVAL